MKEINATFTKKQNLLSNRNKGKQIIREGNFVSGTFPKIMCERSQVKKSGYFKGSSQFHHYWQISTLPKYSPFFGVKNLKSVSRIGGKTIPPYLSKMSAIVQANMRSPSGNCNATKTIQKNKW